MNGNAILGGASIRTGTRERCSREQERMIRCVLAADHTGVRTGLRMVLELFLDGSIVIVGEAATAPEAIAMTVRLQPDVLLVDLARHAADDLQVIRGVRAEVPITSVVVMALVADAARRRALEEAGASAVVLKQAPADALITAIEAATAGHR